MNITRRETLVIGAGGAAALALPSIAWAEDNGADALIKEFTGGAAIGEGGVALDAPEIAENGNTVPVGVSAEGAETILLVSTGNPNPEVAQFTFGRLAAGSTASTRIRLAQTQDLIAVAKMPDGSFRSAKAAIKVTIGGCGG